MILSESTADLNSAVDIDLQIQRKTAVFRKGWMQPKVLLAASPAARYSKRLYDHPL